MSDLERYPKIIELLDKHGREPSKEAKNFLSELSDHHLESIEKCLSVVDIGDEPTKDWIDGFRKGTGGTTSAFAEMILLYHLRENFGEENVEMNARITEDSESTDFDLRLPLEDDVWIEITRRDIFNDMSELQAGEAPEEQVRSISDGGAGKAVDKKLMKDFKDARNELSEDKILIIGLYLEKISGQLLEVGNWLDQEYYDVTRFCDGLIAFSHMGETTKFEYYSFTDKGKKALEKLESRLGKSSENSSY